MIRSLEESRGIQKKYEGELEEYKEEREKEIATLNEELERAQLLNTSNEELLKAMDIAISNVRMERLEFDMDWSNTQHLKVQKISELEKKLDDAQNAETARTNQFKEEMETHMRACTERWEEMVKEQKEKGETLIEDLGREFFEKRKLEDTFESLISELALTQMQIKDLEKVKEEMESKEEEWKRTEEQSLRRIAKFEELGKEAFYSELACKNRMITLQAYILQIEVDFIHYFINVIHFSVSALGPINYQYIEFP